MQKMQAQYEFPTGIPTDKTTDFDPGDVGRYVEQDGDRGLFASEVEYARRYE